MKDVRELHEVFEWGWGHIINIEKSKEQLMKDMDIFVNNSKKKWLFYTPVFMVFAPDYHNKIYADDDFLKILNNAIGENNRKFYFVFNKDTLENRILDNKNNDGIKDIPTLAKEGMIELRIKWNGQNYDFKYGDIIKWNIGNNFKHVRSYMIDRDRSIFYLERDVPKLIEKSIEQKYKEQQPENKIEEDLKDFKRRIIFFFADRNIGEVFYQNKAWFPPFEPELYSNNVK